MTIFSNKQVAVDAAITRGGLVLALGAAAMLSLTGCATTDASTQGASVPAPIMTGTNTRPELRSMPMASVISFAYTIHGDPGALPTQVFDDGRHLFMQFRPDEPPPIPHTTDGRLLEFEVMQGGLVRVIKVPSLVLRLGPRTAFVQHQNLEILGLSGLALSAGVGRPATGGFEVEPPAPVASSVQPASTAVPIAPSFPLTLDLSDLGPSALSRLIPSDVRGMSLQVCHGPRVSDMRAALSLAQRLRHLGAQQVEVTDTCQERGRAVVSQL